MSETSPKPFTLAPIKSPEEIALEGTRKMAPEIRGAVRGLRIAAGAKFFFDALLDLSFLHCYGGSGRGKIFISTKDLSRLTRHNKDTITNWKEILEEERLIWVRESWPKSEWRICALCPPPVSAHNGSEADYIRGKAASHDTGEQSGNLPLGAENGQNAVFGPNSAPSSDTKRKTSACPSEEPGQSVRRIPPDRPKNPDGKAGFSGQTVRKFRTDCPDSSDGVSENPGQTVRILPPVCPKDSASVSEGFRANKETPLGEQESRSMEGGATPPGLDVPSTNKWLKRIDRMFPRELEKVKSDLKLTLKNLLTEKSKNVARWKLKQVEERLTGPQPAEEPATQTPAPAPPKPKPVPLDPEKRAALFAKARKEAQI